MTAKAWVSVDHVGVSVFLISVRAQLVQLRRLVTTFRVTAAKFCVVLSPSILLTLLAGEFSLRLISPLAATVRFWLHTGFSSFQLNALDKDS